MTDIRKKTKCPECGTELVIMETVLVIPQTMGYRVIYGCKKCPTKLEAHRTLAITELGAIVHPEEPLVQFEEA